MKLTLWFLNRINQWEIDRPGQLAGMLANNGRHDVRLGQRIREGSKTGDSHAVHLEVNQGEDSFRGELMHEGYSFKAGNADPSQSRFDEYFVPIPIKCLGLPEKQTAFWQDLIKDSEAFKQIRDANINACFREENGANYWDAVKKVKSHRRKKNNTGNVKDLSEKFTDVRINTHRDPAIGYYQILQQAKEQHGMNVLVGYSQGGLVANYLAYIDEHLVRPEKRCIAAVISVHGPLRGSTLGMHEVQEHVLKSLVEAVRPGWEGHRKSWILPWLLPLGDLEAACAPLFDGQITIEDVTEIIDLLYARAKTEKMKDRLKTARKWLSGLSDDEDLAFVDIDPLRMSREGTVLHALNAHPLTGTLRAAVCGSDFHLGPVIEDALPSWLRIIEKVSGFFFRKAIRHAEDVIRRETFDMMPNPALRTPELEQLHSDWAAPLAAQAWNIKNHVDVPDHAHDFVIPTASQLIAPQAAGGDKFLGNYVNPDASHLSGAADITSPTSDFETVKKVLSRIAGMIPQQ